MKAVYAALIADENGFVISAELTLVATIVVIGMIVGLSEVQHAVVAELNDVGDAFGSINQSYMFSGASAKDCHKVKSKISGSSFTDQADDCDNNQCDITCDGPSEESQK